MKSKFVTNIVYLTNLIFAKLLDKIEGKKDSIYKNVKQAMKSLNKYFSLCKIYQVCFYLLADIDFKLN